MRSIRPHRAVAVDLPSRSTRGLRFRKHHQGLELIPAGFALPQMPHTLRTEILRPFRHEDGLATLCAKIAQARLDGFPDAGSELHSAFSSVAARFMALVVSPFIPTVARVSRMVAE